MPEGDDVKSTLQWSSAATREKRSVDDRNTGNRDSKLNDEQREVHHDIWKAYSISPQAILTTGLLLIVSIDVIYALAKGRH